jgi:hypothetical protein
MLPLLLYFIPEGLSSPFSAYAILARAVALKRFDEVFILFCQALFYGSFLAVLLQPKRALHLWRRCNATTKRWLRSLP